MRSRQLASLTPLLSLLFSACGLGPEGGTPPPPASAARADDSGPPVAVARAELLGALSAMPGSAVRAALAFSIYSEELEGCLAPIEVTGALDLASDADYETALALQRCFWFSERGSVEMAGVELSDAAATTVDIPLLELPDDAALTGSPGAALGIADIVLYADDDGDMAFDETPLGALSFTDRVLGTSRLFRDDDVDDSFLVWRDGDLSPLWKVYRGIYGCEEPPQGLSTVTLELLDVEPWVSCTIDERAVSLEMASLDVIGSLACAADPDRHVPRRPQGMTGLPPSAVAACVQADGWYDVRYTVDVESVCPRVERYDLVGCSDLSSESACFATYWDLLGDVPGWWPCRHSDGSAVSMYLTETGALSDDADELFTLSFYDGLGLFALEDLTVTVAIDDAGTTVPAAGDDLILVDRDGNGVFNAGDDLRVFEHQDVFGPGTTPGAYPVTILVDGVDLLEGAPRYYMPVALPELPPFSLTALDGAAPITVEPDDVARVSRGDDDADAFTAHDLHVGCYVGGEMPVHFSGAEGELELVEDVDQDGFFDSGDILLLREGMDGQITPELLQSFGSTLWCDVRVDVGMDAWVHAGGFEVSIE